MYIYIDSLNYVDNLKLGIDAAGQLIHLCCIYMYIYIDVDIDIDIDTYI